MRETIIRKTNNAPDGGELFAGISGNFKEFGQTLCELTDNSISNFRAHNIRGRIEITLMNQDTYVDVSVCDNGTGIEDVDAALTIAARSCAESALNEHGMGLKHALASINAGADQHWSHPDPDGGRRRPRPLPAGGKPLQHRYARVPCSRQRGHHGRYRYGGAGSLPHA